MALFPSLWKLLLPNFTLTTLLGLVMIGVGVLGLMYLLKLQKLLPFFRADKLSFFLIFIGVLLVWGVSIVQDIVTSPGGFVVTIGTISIILTWYLLFYKSNEKPTMKRGLLE